MAITNNGTRNSLPAAQLPTGYVRPVVTTFTDGEYTRTLTLSIPKATVENADPAVTMANIISNGTVGITKQISDILAADYLASATVTAFADLVGLGNNFQSMATGSPALTNAAAAYQAVVVLYVKAL
jgi:hypothetical protein